MQFNEHQLRLFDNMLKSIADFRKGDIPFYDFVGGLEGALHADEFHNEDLTEQWYVYWTPLEILRAQKGNEVTLNEANKYITDIELFLRSILSR